MPLFTPFNPRIHISIGAGLTEENSHGSLWTKPYGANGKVVPVYFLINKPRVVRNGMTFANWSALNSQIQKMGIEATHIELCIEGKKYCYQMDKYVEIYSGHTSESAVIRHGFA